MTNEAMFNRVLSRREKIYRDVAQDLIRQDHDTARLQLRVISDSMRPLICAGDLIEVERVEPQDLRVGDVIVVQRHGEFITHRLLKVDNRGWHTHGDNLRSGDALATRHDIVGRVVIVERGAQRIDLQQPRWHTINGMIGALDRFKLGLLGIGRRLRPYQVQSQASSWWAAAAAWPFQWLTRLIVAGSVRSTTRMRRYERRDKE